MFRDEDFRVGNTLGLIYVERLIVTGKGVVILGTCQCGNSVRVSRGAMRQGVQSCGCFKKSLAVHEGLCWENESEFKTWKHMLDRCYDPSDPGYKNYGGRGITVCERWRASFPHFLEDVGKRPTPQHTLDRKDNDGNYSSENCRWATRAEQSRNTRRTILIEFEGRSMCLKDWAAETGIDRMTLKERFKNGWSVSDALTIPKQAPGAGPKSGRRVDL